MVLTSTYLSVINFFVVGHVSGGNLILFAKKKKKVSRYLNLVMSTKLV